MKHNDETMPTAKQKKDLLEKLSGKKNLVSLKRTKLLKR